ncbi:hypothetical protein CP08DC60_0408A, partial [Chlamydia psittaci 08DC60]
MIFESSDSLFQLLYTVSITLKTASISFFNSAVSWRVRCCPT